MDPASGNKREWRMAFLVVGWAIVGTLALCVIGLWMLRVLPVHVAPPLAQ